MIDPKQRAEDYISAPADPQAHMSIRYGQYVQDIRNAYIAGAEMKAKEYVAEMRRYQEQLLSQCETLIRNAKTAPRRAPKKATINDNRCRDCRHFATVDYFGRSIKRMENIKLSTFASCPFRPSKANPSSYPTYRAGAIACPEFEKI